MKLNLEMVPQGSLNHIAVEPALHDSIIMAQLHDEGIKIIKEKLSQGEAMRVSPTKGVQRFGIKGKLAPRYIGPFEIIETCGPIAYRIRLPSQLATIHDVFHVSQLKKCIKVPTEILEPQDIEVEPDFILR